MMGLGKGGLPFKHGNFWYLAVRFQGVRSPPKTSRQYRAPEVILSMGCLVLSNVLVMKTTRGWGDGWFPLGNVSLASKMSFPIKIVPFEGTFLHFRGGG